MLETRLSIHVQTLIWLTSKPLTTWRSTTWWKRTFEGLRGARLFHLVSLSLQISLVVLPGLVLGVCVGFVCFWLVLFFVGFLLLPGKFDFILMLIPVVDRPCLALVRQCRKKKTPPVLPCGPAWAYCPVRPWGSLFLLFSVSDSDSSLPFLPLPAASLGILSGSQLVTFCPALRPYLFSPFSSLRLSAPLFSPFGYLSSWLLFLQILKYGYLFLTPIKQSMLDRYVGTQEMRTTAYPPLWLIKVTLVISLANAEGDTLDGFMAALPEWNIPPVSGDPSPLLWRLIWTWHPVLEGLNRNANSSYSPDPWFYPSELYDNQKEIHALLPVEIENYQDHVIVHPQYRLIVFHHTSKPRNKMINFLTSRLTLPGTSAYFLSLKNRKAGDPLPTIPDWVNDLCARKLHDALLVLLKQRAPHDAATWKTYVKTHHIRVPDRPITVEELQQTSTPPTAEDFPPISDTVAPKHPAKARVAAKKGSLTTQTTTALRPSVPFQPGQAQVASTASSSTSPPPAAQSPIPPAASSSRPSSFSVSVRPYHTIPYPSC